MAKRASDHPLLVELGILRGRLVNGFDYRIKVAADDARYQKGTRRWYRYQGEYLEKLMEFQEAVPHETVRAMITELEARLDKGWAFPPGEHEELFTELLRRYEAAQDAVFGLLGAKRLLEERSRIAIANWLRCLPEEDKRSMLAEPHPKELKPTGPEPEETEAAISELRERLESGALPDTPFHYRPGQTIAAGRLAEGIQARLRDYENGSPWARSVAAVHLVELWAALNAWMEAESGHEGAGGGGDGPLLHGGQ